MRLQEKQPVSQAQILNSLPWAEMMIYGMEKKHNLIFLKAATLAVRKNLVLTCSAEQI